MKKTFWITGLVILWLVLVIRSTPAQWGLWAIGSPLQMEGISGTVWSGRAANVVLPFQNYSYTLGELQWDLSPWSLLTLKPCITLRSEYQSQSLSGQACVSPGGDAEFSNVVVELPAQMARLWLPVEVKGALLFRIDRLELENNRVVSLSGKGRWDDAYYHNSLDWMKLGAVAFDFKEGPDGGVLTQVVDVEGPLKLDLLYQFSLQGTYALNGDIIIKPEAPAEFTQILSVVAEQRDKNHFVVEWAGS